MRAPLAGLQVTVARHCGVREKQFGPTLLDKTTGWMSLHQWLDVSHIVAPSNTCQEGTSILRGQLLLGDLLQTTSSWIALLTLMISYTCLSADEHSSLTVVVVKPQHSPDLVLLAAAASFHVVGGWWIWAANCSA